MSINQPTPKSSREILKLKRPMSVAIYDEYADAAHAVDYLADRQFPVENLAIVGTDLKSVEKVTGNVTWPKVLFAGFLQGSMWAGMFALFMWFMSPGSSLLTMLLMALLGFGGVGMAMSAFQYRARGGERDYTSTTAIIATHYEVLAEADVVDRARHLLTGGAVHQTRQLPEAAPPAPPVDLGGLPPPFGQQPQPAPQQPLPAPPLPAGPPPYWGANDPAGIGTAPSGDGPTGFERPRRIDEADPSTSQ